MFVWHSMQHRPKLFLQSRAMLTPENWPSRETNTESPCPEAGALTVAPHGRWTSCVRGSPYTAPQRLHPRSSSDPVRAPLLLQVQQKCLQTLQSIFALKDRLVAYPYIHQLGLAVTEKLQRLVPCSPIKGIADLASPPPHDDDAGGALGDEKGMVPGTKLLL